MRILRTCRDARLWSMRIALAPPGASAGGAGSRRRFGRREGAGGVGGAQGRAAALPGRTVRAEALRPAAQVAARVPESGRSLGSGGAGQRSRYHEGARYHPRLQLQLQPRVLSALGLRDAGWERGPRGPAAASPPPPVRVRRSPARRRRGGRDWARSEVGRDLEKPPRLHCSGRGRPEEPVPRSRLPAGRSRSAVPRCLDLSGPGGSAWRGRGARLRGGPRPAD